MADEAPDFIPDDETPDFIPDDHPAVAQAASSDVQQPPDFIPDDADGGDVTAAGRFTRALAKEQAPLAGSLAGAGIGAGLGALTPIPGGALIGGLAGAFAGSYGMSHAQDWLLDKMGFTKGNGFFSDEQAQADAAYDEKHPWARRAADVIGTAEAFTGGPASGIQRLASGGINAAMEGGQQYAQGKFDPTDIALKAAEGFALPNMRGGADRIFSGGAAVVDKAAASLGVAGRTAPIAARGESATPPPEDANVGNAVNPPEASERAYPKVDNAAPDSDNPGVTQGETSPDIQAAITPETARAMPDAALDTHIQENTPDVQPQPTPKLTDGMSDEQLVEASKMQREANQPRGNGLGGDQVEGVPDSNVAPSMEAAPGPRYPNPVIDGQTINRTLPVAEGVKVKGNTAFVDRNLPPSIQVGDKTIDPAVPLALHEQARQNAAATQERVPGARRMDPAQRQQYQQEYADHVLGDWAGKNGYDPQALTDAVNALRPKPAEPEVTAAVTPPDLSQMQEIGNKPGQRPDAATGPKRPMVIDTALDMLKQRNSPDASKIAEHLGSLPPEEQPALATKIIRQLTNRSGAVRNEQPQSIRVPSKPAEASNGVTARTKGRAAEIDRALKAADAGFEKGTLDREYDPRKEQDRRELLDKLKDAVQTARAQNRGQLPHDTYKPTLGRGENAQKPPASWSWVKAADRLVSKKGVRSANSIAEFLATDKLLRSGRAEDADMATKPDTVGGGRSGDQALAAAEKERANDIPNQELVPAEDVKGVETPLKTAEDVQKFENPEKAPEAEKIDFSKLSDEELDQKLAEKGGDNWKDIAAKAQETVAEKMARQRAAREAAGKVPERAGKGYEDDAKPTRPKNLMELAKDMSQDERGSGKLPTFKEVPRGAWKAMFGTGEPTAPTFIRRFFNPEAVSKLSDSAAALIRERGGVAARTLAQAHASVEQFRRIVNEAPEADRLNIMRELDTGKSVSDAKYKPIIDTLRPMFKDMRAKLEALPSLSQQEFVENYFPHMYRNPAEGGSVDFSNFFQKQGSGSSLHERSIPTLDDALKAGYKLFSTDPVEVSLRYLTSMHAYVRSVEVLQRAMDADIVKQYDRTTVGGASGTPDTSLIPAGYAKIEGRTLSPGQDLYAPEDWARVYNNYLDPGFKANPLRGKLYDAMQKTSNSVTSLELGLSAYHAFTMSKESMINDMAKAISQLASGEVGAAAKSAGLSPAAPYRLYKIGSAAQKVYLGETTNVPPEVAKIVDAMEKSGGRLVGRSHDPTYEYSSLGSLFDSWKRGALSNEWADVKSRVGDEKGGWKAWQAAKEIASGVGRVMQTAAAPLFDKYIPAIKAGAFYDTLHEWSRLNPDASQEELVAAARKIGDSVDNRFGEMVHDNIFADKMLKQGAQVMMRSWSWNLGTAREIGGGTLSGLSDLSRVRMGSPNYDPRVAYVLAMPLVVAATSMMYQFLKTGKGPGDALDLMVPQTGGDSARYKAPERAILPGYEKDVFGFADDPIREAANKAATAPRLVWDTLTNKDYKDQPISNPNDPVGKRVMDWLKYVGGNLGPISVRQIAEGSDRGSNITMPERAAAIRPAPAGMINPRYIDAVRQQHNARAWGQKTRADRKTDALRDH